MSPDPDRAPAAGRLPRRSTDRVENTLAWVLTAAALLLIVVAGAAGLAVHGHEAERAELESGSTSQGRAVLLADVRMVPGENGVRMPVRAPARWTDRTGTEHSVVVPVTGSAPAGAEIDVWIDDRGEISSRPTRPENAVMGGVVAVIGVLAGGGTLLLATWMGVRSVTGLFNSRRWEKGWARVEPEWRRKVL